MIVITGASGMVGGNLVRALLAQGKPVRALVHHDRRSLDNLAVETISADLTNADSLHQAFAGAETVYHLASSISIRMDAWEEVERVNVEGTRNVVEACLQCGVRQLIYFSSIHAYQQAPLDQALDEDRPLVEGESTPPYERSKALAEMIVRRAVDRGLDTIILIPTAIVGPYDYRPSLLGQALKLLATGHIPALVEGGYDWVDVRDVVQGAVQAQQTGKSGERYILSGHWRSLQEIAQITARHTGVAAPKLVVPIWLAELFQPVMATLAQINNAQPLYTKSMLSAMRSNRQISHAKASQELGYAPRPFDETLQDTLDWFRCQKEVH